MKQSGLTADQAEERLNVSTLNNSAYPWQNTKIIRSVAIMHEVCMMNSAISVHWRHQMLLCPLSKGIPAPPLPSPMTNSFNNGACYLQMSEILFREQCPVTRMKSSFPSSTSITTIFHRCIAKAPFSSGKRWIYSPLFTHFVSVPRDCFVLF